MQNHSNIMLNAYHIKICDSACFRASVAKFFDFPLYYIQQINELLLKISSHTDTNYCTHTLKRQK